jgi:CRISPR/Cas system CSM-associated protein Csm2 small subunit
MDQENKLVEVIKESGLDVSKSDGLMKSFAGFYSQAREIVESCKDIQVTDETQKDLILNAKENRGKLRDIRLEADKTRIKLKEQSLREGRAIQGVYNVLEALIKPVEEHLEKQEKFAEFREKERKLKLLNGRIEELSKYVSDVSLYKLEDMADEVFDNLLSGCKSKFETAQKEQKEAEEREKQRLENEKIKQDRRIEFAPYKEYIDIGDELVIDMGEKEYKLTLEKAKSNKKTYEENQEKIRIENKKLQDKIDADRIEKEKQDKIKADEQAKIDADKKAQEEIERKKLLAPDKDKLLELADIIDKIQMPNVASDNAGSVIKETKAKLDFLTNLIREKAKQL